MKRRIIGLLMLFILSISLSGCKPFLYKETNTTMEEEEISYKVEQVKLSKGYQTIEPKVEILKKNLGIKLLLSLGLVESSGVNISKIVKTGNEVNIYINNENQKKSQLVVPQLIIQLKGSKLKKLDNLKFNIVNENYKPIKLKFGMNEAINKINSRFKIGTNTSPITDLVWEDDNLFWDVTYNNIFDKNNLEAPLANLSVQIDANTGDIIKSSKTFISSLIDEGCILDYIPDKYILYTKPEVNLESNLTKENLWYYDIDNNTKSLVYSSNLKINTALFSPDLKHISLVESDENIWSLFIIPQKEMRAYKVLFEEPLLPKVIRWNGNQDIYIVDNTNIESSIVYNYNLKDNKTDLVSITDKNILGLRILKNSFLFTEGDLEKTDLKIYYTKDWDSFRLIDKGYSPRFIDEDKVAYLKKNEKEDKNILHIYDIEEREKYDSIDLNISNFFVLPDENIVIVEKNQNNNDFTVLEYDLKDKDTSIITKVNSDKLFYNKAKNLLYVDLLIPFESDKTELIYSIDLSKLTNLEP